MCGKNVVKALVLSTASAIALFAGSQSAKASLTTIGTPYFGEANQASILANTYGGTFSGSGSNFTNGNVTATRVDDSADQTWTAAFTSARVVGKFASFTETLGYFDGATGGSFHSILTAAGYWFGATGSASNLNLSGNYRLASSSQGGAFTSANADNAGEDHMITYRISGLNDGSSTYVMFFEDTAGLGSDHDFNDLSVEMKTAAIQAPPQKITAVPLPGSAMMGITTLIGAGAVGGARRLRKQTA